MITFSALAIVLVAVMLFSRGGRKELEPPPVDGSGIAWVGDPIIDAMDSEGLETNKVNIRGVVKNAAEIRKGRPLRLRTRGGKGRVLHYAAAVMPGGPSVAVRITVLADTDRVDTLELLPGGTAGWYERSVRLPDDADEIVVRTDSVGEGVFIGHPRVVKNDDERRSFYFVLIDALRADALGVYGAEGDPSPNLDRQARDGVYFTRTFTSSPFTLTSVSSIFTALHPWQHQVMFTKDAGLALSPDVPTLVEEFRKAGYHTAAFSGTYFFISNSGLGQGFDHVDERCAAAFFKDSADCLNGRAEEWLSDQAIRGPKFVYIHYVDTHAPYYAPDKHRLPRIGGLSRPSHDDVAAGEIEQYGENRAWRDYFREPSASDLAYLRALYQGEVNYVDAMVGRLIREARSAESGAPPVFLFTADHAEAFYEHGAMGHVADIHDPVMRVPFILSGLTAEGARGTAVGEQARTIDMLPTLLDAAGIEAPEGIQGRSLLGLLRGGTVAPAPAAAVHFINASPEYALVAWPWKLISFPSGKRNALYKLDDDPAESKDLSMERPREHSAMSEILGELLSLPSPLEGKAPPPMDRSTLDRMGDLGYIQKP